MRWTSGLRTNEPIRGLPSIYSFQVSCRSLSNLIFFFFPYFSLARCAAVDSLCSAIFRLSLSFYLSKREAGGFWMRPGNSIDFDKAQTRDDLVLRGVDLLNPTTSDGRFFLLPSFLFNSFFDILLFLGDDRTRRRKQKERWVDKGSASLSIYFPGLILFRRKIQSEEVRCVEWPSFSPYSTLRLSRVSKVKVYIIDAQRKDEVGVGHWTCSSSFYFLFLFAVFILWQKRSLNEPFRS